MDVGVVALNPEMLETTPLGAFGFKVLWQVTAADSAAPLAGDAVEAVVMLLTLPNTDHIVSVLRTALLAQPEIRVLLLCSAPGQPGILSEISTTSEIVWSGRVHGRRTKLTPRQTRVLTDIRAGMTNREIAVALGVSISTVNRHVEHILGKLGVRNRTQAAAYQLDASEA